MKKRTAAILMTLVMLFSVVTTALGEEKWTCPECGKRNAVSMGDICPYCGTHRHIHTWQDATCTEPRTCTGCGETEGEPAGHDWDDGVVTKAATCVNEGNMTYTCTTCGETKQKTIEKNENEHDAETEVRGYKEATCVEDGYSGDVYCKGCEAMINGGETIAATGEHEWDEATYDAPKTCRVCGATEGEPLVRVKVGDYITYGTYPQTTAGNDSTPIEWLVLEYDEKNNKALLISRYGLDCQPYNSGNTTVTWETCTLRTWLNGTFLNKAFSKAEQGAIMTTNVDNSSSQCYSGYSTNGGNNTRDKIFLLSYAEAWKYFKNDEARECKLTEYAVLQNVYTYNGNCWWWLRSPGSSSFSAANVLDNGGRYDFHHVHSTSVAVRPAFWLDLSGIGTGDYAVEESVPYATGLAEVTAAAGLVELTAIEETATYGAVTETEECATVEVAVEVVEEAVDLTLYKAVGNYVTYGTYPQTAAGNDSTPIEWLVLEYDEKNNRALLISRYGLDWQPYNTKNTDVTWETCSLRAWLNDTFLNEAFSKAEQGAILTTNVDNSKSQGYYSTNGGNNTQDKIFLLSYAEANKHFNVQHYSVSGAKNNTKSRVAPTAYAIAQGAYTSSSDKTADESASGRWWLRSPGPSRYNAALVGTSGSLGYYHVRDKDIAVRPAFWLDLSGI